MVGGFLAGAALLSLTAGLLLSVMARRFQELEGKVDMVTTLGLARDPLEPASHQWPAATTNDDDAVQADNTGGRAQEPLPGPQ